MYARRSMTEEQHIAGQTRGKAEAELQLGRARLIRAQAQAFGERERVEALLGRLAMIELRARRAAAHACDERSRLALGDIAIIAGGAVEHRLRAVS